MDFGEKKIKFSHRELSVVIDAFREAAVERMRKGNDPLWHLGMLSTFESMYGRYRHTLSVPEGRIVELPLLKGIVAVVGQYTDSTQEAIVQITNTHPKNEVLLPLQRKTNGVIAERMVLEFQSASNAPATVGGSEADRLVDELSIALKTATADDFGSGSQSE